MREEDGREREVRSRREGSSCWGAAGEDSAWGNVAAAAVGIAAAEPGTVAAAEGTAEEEVDEEEERRWFHVGLEGFDR